VTVAPDVMDTSTCSLAQAASRNVLAREFHDVEAALGRTARRYGLGQEAAVDPVWSDAAAGRGARVERRCEDGDPEAQGGILGHEGRDEPVGLLVSRMLRRVLDE